MLDWQKDDSFTPLLWWSSGKRIASLMLEAFCHTHNQRTVMHQVSGAHNQILMCLQLLLAQLGKHGTIRILQTLIADG
ncbi:hypothetical protein D3C80_1368090 [compost metagenome]